MITAGDTNVLVDVFKADSTFGPRSAEVLQSCLDEGLLVACDIVWAETGTVFVRHNRLLTRDRGFYRDYFEKLRIIDPTEDAL
jgi:predicted nucleic acid-binding protein